ncbi:MAG: GTPase Era [Candidatus Cloacimonetes bacterium]|nr:GTPase Era [Candidatus Cloacimonadota bacterium]
MNDSEFRCGFVSIVGKSNVGKSTISNKLIGEKLSIISPKPQTTRVNIKGILNDSNKQIIFLDTPGFVKARYELHNKMNEYIKNAFTDSDVIMFITDANAYPTEYDTEVIRTLSRIKDIPKIALMNKIDLITEEVLERKLENLRKQDFEIVIPLSAIQKDDFSDIIEVVTSFLPFNPPFYDTEQLSDLPMRFFVKETILEQIFLNYEDEIPYSSAVVVEKYEELPNKILIQANIWVERDTQKAIIIGNNGEKIKKIRKAAESQCYKLTGSRTQIELWVKVKSDWRKKKNAIKEFGYR